ncbi:MAG: phosphate/phosphite/phosphonate ABC transporter substrate-binding protein [Deltaproteobacteria bacterium]|nr:phosphate/phosphite/phosphonate ABC transporter substrate-binding protein [Deltaproteobacteria bacterium]
MADRAISRFALGTVAAALLVPLAVPVAVAAPDTAPAAPAEQPPVAASDDAVGFVVLRENGTGSAAQAQRYLDSLVTNIARINGWAAATGKYFTSRKKTEKHVAAVKPSFGFLSFGAYLGLRKAHGIEPVAIADAGASGGAQYFVISKNHVTVEDCKGKTLATNHAADPHFIDAVVSADAFDLADFEVQPMRRPVQTLKAVINDEAECALVDDSQIVAATKVDGGAALRPVWSSSEFPAIVVVSFGSAPAEQAKSFRTNIESICNGDGRAACDAAGLVSPRSVSADAFAAQQTAYDG